MEAYTVQAVKNHWSLKQETLNSLLQLWVNRRRD